MARGRDGFSILGLLLLAAAAVYLYRRMKRSNASSGAPTQSGINGSASNTAALTPVEQLLTDIVQAKPFAEIYSTLKPTGTADDKSTDSSQLFQIRTGIGGDDVKKKL